MTLVANSRLGPYEIVGLLGAGGMGEVYRARDPRLSREVAVKLITADGASSPERLSRFETEARAAAQLAHPNVVTVFDVGNHEGQPYLVLELLDGQTLRETIRAGTPPLRQSLTWALEAARGLGAAHERGIIHRDLKPENIFLTTEGRVKVLDFGLAKLQEPLVGSASETSSPTATKDTSPGVIMGTIGYMAPEQVKGEPAVVRSDVFALGAVLYELLAGRRAFTGGTAAEILASILRDEPQSLMTLRPEIPAPVETVVRRCLGKHATERFSTGNEVAAALETALASLEPSRTGETRGAEPRGPYPGLSSFTEADAERFFGRESEVEALWDKLRQRRLLALIGPSGAGKTSFVRAGLIPSRPTGWGTIAASPGAAPMKGLAQALVGALPSGPDTMRELLAFDDPEVAYRVLQKWRKSHLECLLVLDQFEELFTLNPPEVQAEFTNLLGRLVAEGDVHVLLSMRDDFLIRCYDHETLAPVFQNLTPLVSLGGEDLRRALVEPAKKEGFSFENEGLVDEMLESVEGARGALPLLAFAVARLWEKRDREKKLLNRKAYEAIGGVAGALAQHAEQTLERIGLEREPLVRELFRNLVTAQWTRAVADREELLSVLPERSSAEQVLDELIGARLLTSYEVRDPDRPVSGSHPERALSGDGTRDAAASSTGAMRAGTAHRIEIVHESLLRAWPRLVRWQAQDEEGAVLRDQLKQAAHLWEEKSRSPDVLWTGTAFQEFELWRDRYKGKLTALEEEYSTAMIGRATRRRRLRRSVGAVVIVVLAGVAAAIAVSRQEVARSRDEARAEATRAEASKLLALAQARLADDPTEALALTTASLELADTADARAFAVQALWEGPPIMEVASREADMYTPNFSPDGRWLAVAGHGDDVHLWAQSGNRPTVLSGHTTTSRGSNVTRWTTDGLLITGHPALGNAVHVWSTQGKRLRTVEFGAPSGWQVGLDRLLVETEEGKGTSSSSVRLRSWRLPDGEAEELGRVDPGAVGGLGSLFDPTGDGWLYVTNHGVYRRPLPVGVGRRDRVFSPQDGAVSLGMWPNRPGLFFLVDQARAIQLWSFPRGAPASVEAIAPPKGAAGRVYPEPSGRWFANRPGRDQEGRLWDGSKLPGARPLRLRRARSWYAAKGVLHPRGDWYLATTGAGEHLTFWPLRKSYPSVVDGYAGVRRPLAFSPDGRWLASSWSSSEVRLWPVPPEQHDRGHAVELPGAGILCDIGFSPDSDFVLVTGSSGEIHVVGTDRSPARSISGFPEGTLPDGVAVSPSGLRAASGPRFGEQGPDKSLRVWDLESGRMSPIKLPEGRHDLEGGPVAKPGYRGGIHDLHFADEQTLYTAGDGGLRRWDLESGQHELVAEAELGGTMEMAMSLDARLAFTVTRFEYGWDSICRSPVLIDTSTSESRPLDRFGECVRSLDLDPTGTIAATGDANGIVRVGKLDGEPQLLFGHKGLVDRVEISPDLKWVASAGEDNTLRLWPMPDLDERPLHALSHEDLLAKLKSLTNLRAVRDAESSTGWTIEVGPFPGWKEVPEW